MRHHNYANTTAQQQPQRFVDRQQQQSSGSGDHQPPRPAPFQLGSHVANDDVFAAGLRQVQVQSS